MRPCVPKRRKISSLLVTAGPTREKIDPIRFISNYSTGMFGYEIAREARRRGLRVTLISGPTCLEPPRGVKCVHVESAFDMQKAVRHEIENCGCLVMAAAVSDWRLSAQSKTKIKRGGGRMRLELVENPDILKEVGEDDDGKILVGFALETEGLRENAAKKLKEKNLDLIIAGELTTGRGPFGENRIDVTIIDRSGRMISMRHKTKRELAKIVLDKALNSKI